MVNKDEYMLVKN